MPKHPKYWKHSKLLSHAVRHIVTRRSSSMRHIGTSHPYKVRHKFCQLVFHKYLSGAANPRRCQSPALPIFGAANPQR